VLARLDAGVASVDRHPVLLQHAVERVVQRERRRFPAVQFEIERPGARGLPAVLADDGAVDQVLSNLLSNAAKYGGSGGTVRVILERRADEVLVHVDDDGPGLPPERVTDLFRLFVRGSDAARRASGAGIGLYVSSRLVEGMGGRIWAADRDEGGARFSVALHLASGPTG
jgi:signal transduction histidine kinase